MGQDQSRAKDGQAGPANTPPSGAAHAGVAGSQGSTIAVVPLTGIEGFQVVRLLPYSPAHKAGLVPYFDIITSLDHVLLETEGKPALQFFKSYVANHRDQPVCFTVFNLHIRAYRDVYCVPSDAWGGGGLLGCSIEWSRAESCPERCVHVMDVLEGSPAAFSGELRANRDYIIGMQTAQEPLISLIKNQKDFYSRIEGWHEEQRWTLERKQRFPSEAVEIPHLLLFLVYNSENNTVKEVAVEMGTNPEAALGMSVATGLLHIIPSAATAGNGATATSLPVMNKFVRLEENQEITSTPEAPPPLTLAPAPTLHAPAPQHEQQPQQERQQQPADDRHPQTLLQDQESSGPQDGHLDPSPVAYTASEANVAPVALPPPTPPQDATTRAPVDSLTSYPPSYTQQVPQPPPAYDMPPSLPDSDALPPQAEPTAIVVNTPPKTGAELPQNTLSAAARPASMKKKSPFQKALASLEAYENPRGAVASTAAPAVYAPPQSAVIQQELLPPPQLHPPPPSPPQAQPPEEPTTFSAAPPALSSPPIAPDHDAPVAPSPSLMPPVQPRPAFSLHNMPPPLHFPLFPGAAQKRQQK